MKFPPTIKVYGDKKFRGKCPSESLEQVTFFARLRRNYPEFGAIAIHPRNEGKRHYAAVNKEKSEGMTTGASDIIIPASPAFVCEMKRQDHTKSRLEPEQIEYLEAAQAAGAFVCIALGCEAATEAFGDWLKIKLAID